MNTNKLGQKEKDALEKAGQTNTTLEVAEENTEEHIENEATEEAQN